MALEQIQGNSSLLHHYCHFAVKPQTLYYLRVGAGIGIEVVFRVIDCDLLPNIRKPPTDDGTPCTFPLDDMSKSSAASSLNHVIVEIVPLVHTENPRAIDSSTMIPHILDIHTLVYRIRCFITIQSGVDHRYIQRYPVVDHSRTT